MHLRLVGGSPPTHEQLAQAYIDMAQEQVDRDDVRIARLKYLHQQELSKERHLRAAGQVEILRLRRQVAELERQLERHRAADAEHARRVRAIGNRG